MHIATWNVNSVKARMAIVTNWLQSTQPDVLLLQEIKCETDSFPSFEFEALGYKAYVIGQKSYNGVAILSRHSASDLVYQLPGDSEDAQARYIEATIQGVRIASIYLPNGNPVGADKFTYKLKWMQRLKKHAAELIERENSVVLAGDFNVIPEPIDVYDPKGWEQDALFRPETRAAFREIVNLGYTEAFRALHPDQKDAYTFWDYQAGSWPRNKGLRIDHFLLSPEATDRLISCEIDKNPRDKEKASDHTPVVIELR
ncbi:MAG: exodeoxyribonuclease III [Alphaproteobacteria bacterium]|nr:exodeoxyribonuclease III [Alphaproteobacteria bacterium]